MQDAFNRDMFALSEVNNPRFNGHVQVSPCGKIAGGKRDRKGCTKGKIEAIMKNNVVRAKTCLTQGLNKKIAPPSSANHVFLNHSIKSEDQIEDPYTFTEPEPQSLSLYQPGSSTAAKKVPNKPTTMVCSDKPKSEPGRIVKPPKVSESASKMNKLQADIARNKIIGKRKKLEQVPSKGKTSDNCNLKRDPNKVCIPAKREARKSTWQRERNSKHELLERIYLIKNNLKQYSSDLYPLGLELSDSDSDDIDTDRSLYERYWFSKSDVTNDNPRERRVEASRAQMRRQLAQTLKGLKVSEDPSTSLLAAVIAAARRFPNATASILNPTSTKPHQKTPLGAKFLITGEKCSYSEGCNWQALPCTRHCTQHIMYNVDQKLFHHCTARDNDSAQCNTPVFDIRHDLPVCARHSQKRDATQIRMEHRHSKKSGKKSRLHGLSKNSKRNNKKRKKLPSLPTDGVTSVTNMIEEIHPTIPNDILYPTNEIECSIIEPTLESPGVHVEGEVVEEVPEEVLAIASLDPAELASQATRLLEEHDLTNVLNQISTDAFNDLFTDKNGEYEPTREETEELERALEAVDKDVRSLERMTRALPLPLLQIPLPLDTIELLEEAPPAGPAGPFPSFQNGFSAPPSATTDIHDS